MSSEILWASRAGDCAFYRTVGKDPAYEVVHFDFGFKRGGKNPLRIAIQTIYPTVQQIDVAVISHFDSDHIGGCCDFIRNWYKTSRTIKEFWIPDLWREISEFEPDIVVTLADIKNLRRHLDLLYAAGSGSTYSEHAIESLSRLFSNKKSKRILKIVKHRVQAVNSILATIKAKAIAIRTFSYAGYVAMQDSAGGVSSFLRPVNSREVLSSESPKPLFPALSTSMRLLVLACLTGENRESLTFFSPESSGEPAVSFTADTDFRFDNSLSNPYVNSYNGQPNVSGSSLALVDAPHHGSIVNDFAYSVINSWLP